jgi:hypothetical protein
MSAAEKRKKEVEDKKKRLLELKGRNANQKASQEDSPDAVCIVSV